MLLSDLTPVISNSNATYVDTLPSHQGARPGMPGFRVPSMDGSAGIIMRKSSIPDTDNDKSVARGLRQRRSCMPLPRAGLPPAKRSSIESNSINPTSIAAGTTTAPSQGLRRMPSNASEDSSLRGTEHLRLSPSNNTERNGDGVGLMMGERLAMPSYGSMCSDDESSLDTSNHAMFNERETMGTTNVSSMFRETAGSNNLAAPIELQPNRKYFSFQGVNQYKREVCDDEDDDDRVESQVRLETIQSPSRRPPASPVKEGHRPALQSLLTMPHGERNQYQPMLRGQHGVKEMADTKDLDAIFKAPRVDDKLPKVVSPYTPMDHQEPQPFFPPREEAAQDVIFSNDHHVHIPPAYPVESKWSIPSIHLANRVNQSLNESLGYSYADCSEYTDDDESYYSFLADDDDTASLSSRGSVDQSTRRMSISNYHALQKRASQEAVMAAAQEANRPPQMIHSQGNAVWPNNNAPSQPVVIAQSNSFLEKISGISIENTTLATTNANANTNADATPANAIPPPLSRRANTFDSELPPPILNVDANNPNVSLTMSGTTMDDADAAANRQSRRRRNRNRSSRGNRRKEGAAVEWLQDLQNQSNVQLFAESASSKFMTSDNCGVGLMVAAASSGAGHNIGGVGQLNADDMTKALGMPHPLCRSSTIEAGPFTVHRGVFGQSVGRNQDGVGLGSGNNSIALTSSGSGD